MDIFVLVVPLVVAIFNPGTGAWSGFGFTIIAIAYFILKYGLPRQLAPVDVIGALAATYVLASQFWAYDPVESGSPSRGAAAVLLYYVVCRQMLTTRRRYRQFVGLVALVTSTFAVIFLLTAQTYDQGSAQFGIVRQGVSFANPNYAGAVLGFGSVVALWLVLVSADDARIRWLGGIGWALQAYAVYETGSRAAFSGMLLGSIVLLLRPAWKASRVLVLLSLPVAFSITVFPSTDAWLLKVSETLQGGTFNRADALYSLSGRDEIWYWTRGLVGENLLFGSGLEGYRLRLPVPVLAHAWGLEFLASVGVVGALLLFTLTMLSYGSWMVGAKGPWTLRASLLNTSTAASLVPVWVLSTHQWTLWAWMAVALWSRSYLVDVRPRGECARDSAKQDASASTLPTG